MNDGSVLILLLLVTLALLWLFVWGPQAKEARVERERRAAEERAERERREAENRARREAERAQLEAERETLLKSIRTGAPDFIMKARLEFERQLRADVARVMAEVDEDGNVCGDGEGGPAGVEEGGRGRAEVLVGSALPPLHQLLPVRPHQHHLHSTRVERPREVSGREIDR